MSSIAERKRRRRARTAAAAEAVRSDAPIVVPFAKPVVIDRDKAAKAQAGRDDGLDFLLDRNRVTRRQARAGRHYGMLYRTTLLGSGASLRSCLAELERVSGKSGGSGPSTDLEAAEWVAECRAGLAAARMALGYHVEMTGTVDLICAHGRRPREITTDQRATEEIETTLRLALDLLAAHFGY